MNEIFEKAVEDAKVLKQRPDKADMISLYGLYKQSTVGDPNIECPGFFDWVGRMKWDAWEEKKGLSKEEAMKMYIDLVEKLKIKYGF